MELEGIFWARLKALKTQAAISDGRIMTNDGRITILEGRLIQSSQTSVDRWDQVKWLAEWAPKFLGLVRDGSRADLERTSVGFGREISEEGLSFLFVPSSLRRSPNPPQFYIGNDGGEIVVKT